MIVDTMLVMKRLAGVTAFLFVFSIHSIYGNVAALARVKNDSDVGAMVDEDDTPEEIYLKAINEFTARDYNASLLAFEDLERSFPASPLTKRAIMMQIFIHYIMSKYAAMENVINTFVGLYPQDRHIAYVMYMKALLSYERVHVPEHSAELITKAYSDFDFVVKNYPNTIYSVHAKRRMIYLNNLQAMSIIRIGEQYQRYDYFFAAIRQYNKVLNMPSNKFVPIAIARLAECYDALGIMSQMKYYTELLRRDYKNFPNEVESENIGGKGDIISDTLRDDFKTMWRKFAWRKRG